MSPKTLFKESHIVGWRQAWANFYQRRHLPVFAYLLLAGFTIYAFSVERDHSNQNRAELAKQTRVVLIRGCERQNQLRNALSGITKQSIGTIKLYVKDGTITPAQGDRSLAQIHTTLRVLRPTDCAKAYPVAKK